MAYFETQGRSNYYHEFGAGKPVLLLHGITNSGRAWAPQIPALVEAGYRVIVPDHAGHGASAPLAQPFGVADIANDTEALLAHLDIRELDIVGLSLGGMVALELALRHPAMLRHLVVACSFDQTATPEFAAMAEGWAAILEQPHGPEIRLEQNWPMLVSEAFRSSAEGLRTYQNWHAIAATTDGVSLAQVARGIGDFDVSDRLNELPMPTLFIAGALDKMSPPAISQRMADQAPQGKFALIEGAAHIANVDMAAPFTAQLLEFLAAA